MQFPSQNNRFLCNHPDGPLKASGRPSVSRSFNIKDVRTSEKHRPDTRSSFSNFYTELDFNSRHCLEIFCKTFGRCPALQNILGILYECRKENSEYFPDPRLSRSDEDLIRIELYYFGKAVAVNRRD
jgi:hypothetical protein